MPNLIVLGMKPFDIPNGRQVVLAAARGLRLSLDTVPHEIKVSASTRKTQARGERVTEQSDMLMMQSVAEAFVRQVVAPGSADPNAPEFQVLRGWVANGITEYVTLWDAAVADTTTFTPAALATPLVALPFVRLGLLDLALRLQARSGPHFVYLLDDNFERRARELVTGKAFIACFKAVVARFGSRRKDMVGAFSEDTVRAWEEGSLPKPETVEEALTFLTKEVKAPGEVHLELRLSVALCELWAWLAEIQIPEAARFAMAEGFLRWFVAVTVLAARESIDADARFMTVLRGARHPTAAQRLETLTNIVTDPDLEADLLDLGGDWSARCRAFVGPLADVGFAAQELKRIGRVPGGVDGPDAETVVALTMCIPKTPFAPREAKPREEPTAADLEAAGTAALQHGDPVAAVRLLRAAVLANPKDPMPRTFLARALHLCGDLDAAELSARAAIALAPGTADAWLVLGAILIDARRTAEALRCLETALIGSMQPDVVHAYRALAMFTEGRFRDALDAAEQGISIAPKNAQCWGIKRRALEATGDADAAKRAEDQVRHLGRSPNLFDPGDPAIDREPESSKATRAAGRKPTN